MEIRFCFAYLPGPAGPLSSARQRGFVVGRRFAGAFLAGAFGVVAFGVVRVRVPEAAAGAFFLAAGLPAVPLLFEAAPDPPDATRDECFVRCLSGFFGGAAASAIDDSANAAMSATNSIFIVLRTIRTSSRSECDGRVDGRGSRYDNAFVMKWR